MKYEILTCDQRSEDWKRARAGRLTGSVAADAMRTYKSDPKKFSAGRKHLRMRLALERLTGRPQERVFTSEAMQWGIDHEPELFGRFEAETGLILDRPGFLSCTEVMAGCSLDAAIMEGDLIKGIVEGKCPESATHLEYLCTREIPEEYRWQCLHNLWVSGADYCWFVSYDPRFPEGLQYLSVKFTPSQQDIKAYQIQALRFLAEVDEDVDTVKRLAA